MINITIPKPDFTFLASEIMLLPEDKAGIFYRGGFFITWDALLT